MLRLLRLSISKSGLNGRSAPSMRANVRAGSPMPGRLDLHHVGAPVGEDPARRRARDPDADLDDAHTRERSHSTPPQSPTLARLLQ